MATQKQPQEKLAFRARPRFHSYYLIVFSVAFALVGGYALYKSFATAPMNATKFPASFHIWGGNIPDIMSKFDIVVARKASDGNPAQARAGGNPNLIALTNPSVDLSACPNERNFSFTYGGGLSGGTACNPSLPAWGGVNDTLSPSPQGTIRSWQSSDWGCKQADGIVGYALGNSSTADFVKKASWYAWKQNQAEALGYNGLWSDNLEPGDIIYAGWFYGYANNTCTVSTTNWDAGYRTVTEGLKTLGVPLIGGNGCFRTSKPEVQKATQVCMYETLENLITYGPSNYASMLAESLAWQKADTANPRYFAVMDRTPDGNAQRLRYGLGLATVMGGAYMPYQTHSDTYEPAEMTYGGKRNYLGVPTADPVRVGDAWYRNFENGVVYANMSAGTVTINGVSVPSHDAVFKVTYSSPPPAAPSVSLSANPTSISSGQSSTLSWSSSNAASCSASGAWSGSLAASGSQTVSPAATATYSLTCSGSAGSATASATVSVSGTAYNVTTTISDGSTLSGSTKWEAIPSGQTTSKVDFYIDNTLKSTENISPYVYGGDNAVLDTTSLTNGTHAFKAVATSSSGTQATIAISANVSNYSTAPTISLVASPTSITSGSTSTLTWNSTNTTSCSASGAWSGTKAISGTQAVSPSTNSVYSLACTGSGGSATASATVTVTAPAPPPPPPPSSDTTPPSTPANFRVTSAGKTSLSLAWDASTDNVGVAGYKLYRNDNFRTSINSLSVSDNSLSAGASYTYYVLSYDAAGNTSSRSPLICVSKWSFWSSITRHRNWSYC